MSEQTAEEKDRARQLKWFHEARFGMFVRWGLYSLLGRQDLDISRRSAMRSVVAWAT